MLVVEGSFYFGIRKERLSLFLRVRILIIYGIPFLNDKLAQNPDKKVVEIENFDEFSVKLMNKDKYGPKGTEQMITDLQKDLYLYESLLIMEDYLDE